MIFVLFVGILFFLIGYTIRLIVRIPAVSSTDTDVSHNVLFFGLAAKFCADVEKYDNRIHCSGFFDSLSVSIGVDTNKALEEIFDIIIERYVIHWYKTLSNDPGFLIQVRMYLQFMSAMLINRIKSIDLTDFSIQKLIPSVSGHVEHLLEILSRTTTTDSLLEDTVLRGLGPHLHICMTSRSAELAYLRALVNRLLPHVSLPPALLPLSKCQPEQVQFSLLNASPINRYPLPGSPRTSRQSGHSRWTRPGGFDGFASHRSSSIGPVFSRQPPWIRLDANRGAYSFLIEILSTCVLLPAMDAVANPDFINKLILSGLDEITDSAVVDSGPSTLVPVLNTYVQEWTEWMAQKPLSNVRLEDLLRQQDDLYPFTQFMKSIRSTEPLTAVLLMNDIDHRVRHEPLAPDSCRELRAQIWHILALLRGSTRTAMEQDSADNQDNAEDPLTACSRLTTLTGQDTLRGMRLLNVPTAFDELLIEVVQKPEPLALSKLVRNSYWKDAYREVFELIEKRYLPMYVESPEYLSHVLGISYRLMGPCPGSPKSPFNTRRGEHGAQMNAGSGLFGNPLKSMFGGHSVEGRLIQDLASNSSRPTVRLSTRSSIKPTNRATNLRDRIAEASSGTGGSDQSTVGSIIPMDPQHQLHSHYLLQSHQVDMSDWNVYIPGLSRPEVQTGRRLIDQLTANASNTTATNTGTAPMTSHESGSAFRMRLFDESTGAAGGRAPQLSPQFMFTVRTERVLDGVRHQIARVDRKYSEFYVLEQKLLEFHGNTIGKQLPRRQYTPRTFEFMDSKREEFEEYLQFLLSQPFLRNSELLFTFLTSKTPFGNNMLFDLNLGRLVKSVPLKLAKEKGQFLDDFLVSFYVSCSPQPILLEPVDPRPRPNSTVITVLPSSGVGTLGGIDSLASPDHYSIKPASSRVLDATAERRRASDSVAPMTDLVKPSATGPAVVSAAYSTSSTTTGSSSNSKSAQCTMLDNRLRARAYWNNAGWSLDRRKEMIDRLCESSVLRWTGLTETVLYLFHGLSEPAPQALPPSAEPLDSAKPDVQAEATRTSDSDRTESGASYDRICTRVPPDPWDVSHAAWSEAFLNGPVAPDQLVIPHDPDYVVSLTERDTPVAAAQLAARDTNHGPGKRVTTDRKAKAPAIGDRQISITWTDCLTALVQSSRLVRQHFAVQVRYFILWASYQLWHYLRVPIDRWLASYLVSYLQTCLTDGYVAYALRLLKTTIFFPYTPSTDVEKSQRRDQTLAAVQRAILKLGFTYISDRDLIEQRLSRVFLCFQQPKWNKQLSYVLLDHLVTSLFPELVTCEESVRMETENAT